MKKFTLYLAVTISMFTFNFQELSATNLTIGDKEPCTEFWLSVEWEGPALMTLNIGDCIYIIEYYYRTTVYGDRHELQIVGIYKIYGDDCTASANDIRKEAYVRLWQINDMGFPWGQYEYIANESACVEYTTSSGQDQFNLIVPNEYISMIDTTGLDYSISPSNDLIFSDIDYWLGCFDDVCCFAYYHITRENGEIVSVEWFDIGGGLSQPECDEPLRCSANCDNLKFNWYAEGYEPKIQGIKANFNDIGTSNILPNPNVGLFTLVFSSKYIGNINIFLTNTKGELVFQEKLIKDTEKISRTLNLTKLPNDLYFYKIYSNEESLSNGSFIINK